MLKKIALALLLILSVPVFLSAQTHTLEEVGAKGLTSREILKDGEVTGYYSFYYLDKEKAKTISYMLKIYDQNLNEVASKKIIGSPTTMLLESDFDGENIMFKFYDHKEDKISYKVYNKQGEFVTKKTRESKYSASVRGLGGGTIFAIPGGNGFVTYRLEKNKKIGYTIEHIKGQAKTKSWTYSSDESSKENQYASLIAYNDEMILSSVGKSPGAFSKKLTNALVACNMTDGKKIFEVDLKDDQYTTTLLNGHIDNEAGEILVFGEYFPIDAKVAKATSLGFYTYQLDFEGNILNKKYISWADDVSKFVDVDEKGKEKGKGFLWFHKVIRTKDGKVFAVGEQYKKAVNVDGVVVGTVLGSLAAAAGARVDNQAALMEMVIDDLVIYEFSPEFDLVNVKVLPKARRSIDIDQGYSTMNRKMLGYMMKAYGHFDYSFTQIRDEKENFTIFYSDYKKPKKEKGQYLVKSLSYQDGEFVEDEMVIATKEKKSSRRWVNPAKPGYVLITEYFPKDKTLTQRLEKINF